MDLILILKILFGGLNFIQVVAVLGLTLGVVMLFLTSSIMTNIYSGSGIVIIVIVLLLSTLMVKGTIFIFQGLPIESEDNKGYITNKNPISEKILDNFNSDSGKPPTSEKRFNKFNSDSDKKPIYQKILDKINSKSDKKPISEKIFDKINSDSDKKPISEKILDKFDSDSDKKPISEKILDKFDSDSDKKPISEKILDKFDSDSDKKPISEKILEKFDSDSDRKPISEKMDKSKKITDFPLYDSFGAIKYSQAEAKKELDKIYKDYGLEAIFYLQDLIVKSKKFEGNSDIIYMKIDDFAFLCSINLCNKYFYDFNEAKENHNEFYLIVVLPEFVLALENYKP